MSSRESCASCGTALVAESLYDEFFGDYFCGSECFVEWAVHTQKPLEYYAARNIVEVDFREG